MTPTSPRRPARLLAVSLGLTVLGLVTGCSTEVSGQPFASADGAPPSAAATAVDAPAAASAAPPDACTLMTLPEATTLANTPLNPPTPAGPSGAATLCEFTGPTSGPVAQVEVYVGDGAKSILDTDRRIGHKFSPLPATGDEAYEEDDNVFFRKGTVWGAIRLVRLNDPAQNRDRLHAAAATVAGRL